MDRYEGIGCLLAIVLVVLFMIAGNFIAIWLWDMIMVAIFGLPALSFWQMFWLRVLMFFLIPHGSSVARRESN